MKTKNQVPDVLIFNMYNFTGDAQLLQLLGENTTKHASIVNNTPDYYNITGEEHISLMRLKFNPIFLEKLLCEETYLFGKKVNLANFFNPNQHQSAIMDVEINAKMKDICFKKLIHHKQNLEVKFFTEKTEKISNKENNLMLYYLDKPTMWCYFRNETNQTQTVNLIDLCKGVNTSKEIRLINNHYRTTDKATLFKNITIVGNIGSTSENPIIEQREDVTKTHTPIINVAQFQNQIIVNDIDLHMDEKTKLTVDVLPRESLMYSIS